MKREKKKTVMMVAMIGLAVFCPLVAAGDLQPPAAPSPTMKTLDEVEPRIPIPGSDTPAGTFIINQSGSYYLEGNRLCSGDGIVVGVNDVTIDLMGYSLIGDNSVGHGINTGTRSNVEIRNGTIRDFASYGVVGSSTYSYSRAVRVIDIRSISNGGSGIYIGAQGGLVKNCTVIKCGGIGIYSSYYSVITGNTSVDNGSYGIYAPSCTITDNVVSGNSGTGIYAPRSVVKNNMVRYNTSLGIYGSYGSIIKDNTVADNTSYGIYAYYYCLIDGNTSYGNGTNLYASTTCQVGLNVAP